VSTAFIIINVIAIVLSPLIALQVSKRLNERQEAEKRKMDVFRNLMATRAVGLSPIHVEALNRIDIEFSENDEKTKAVFEAWKEYRDQLYVTTTLKAGDKEGWANWTARKEILLSELLYKMSIRMGYSFDKVHIKRGYYYPKGYVDIETEQRIIRQGLASIFAHKAAFPIVTWAADTSPLDSSTTGEIEPEKLLPGQNQ
jgi:hypothetical protein